MTDRWNPKLVTSPTYHPPKFFVPGDAISAPSTVVEHPAGFRVRTRGDTEGTVVHAYRCPAHGVFERHVSRASVPDEVCCPIAEVGADSQCSRVDRLSCGRASPWAGSSCGIGVSAGYVES